MIEATTKPAPAPVPKPMILDMGLGSREQSFPLQRPSPTRTR